MVHTNLTELENQLRNQQIDHSAKLATEIVNILKKEYGIPEEQLMNLVKYTTEVATLQTIKSMKNKLAE